MKILTIGLSPYLLTSKSNLHASILKHLFLSNHSVRSIVWGHDTDYFIPVEKNGELKHYYSFDSQHGKIDIPITPMIRSPQESIEIYELVNKLKPDMIITIGDLTDFLFMKAVKMFVTHDVKWTMVYTGYNFPSNDIEIVNDMDGILCTNEKSFNQIKDNFESDFIDWIFCGCDDDFTYDESLKTKRDNYRIITCGKNVQSDNLPVLMSIAENLSNQIPNLEIYLHTNQYDYGDFNIHKLVNRYDPLGKVLKLPEKFISINDGLSTKELKQELLNSDLFISTHMASATSMGVFEALENECPVLMTDCGSNADLAWNSNGVLDNNLIKCVDLVTNGDFVLSVCDKNDLELQILSHFNNREKILLKKGMLRNLSQKYNRSYFLKRLNRIIDRVVQRESNIQLEVVN